MDDRAGLHPLRRRLLAHNLRVSRCRHLIARYILYGNPGLSVRGRCRSDGYGKRGRGEVGTVARAMRSDRLWEYGMRKAGKLRGSRMVQGWNCPTWRSAAHLQEATEWHAWNAAETADQCLT